MQASKPEKCRRYWRAAVVADDLTDQVGNVRAQRHPGQGGMPGGREVLRDGHGHMDRGMDRCGSRDAGQFTEVRQTPFTVDVREVKVLN